MTSSPDDRAAQVDETETAPPKASTKPVAKTTAAKTTPTKTAAAKSTAAKTAAAKSTAAKSTAAKSTAAKTTAAKKPAGNRAPAKPAASKVAPAKRPAATTTARSAAEQAAPTAEVVVEPLKNAMLDRSASNAAPKRASATARTAAAKNTAARAAATKPAAGTTASAKSAAAKTAAAKTAAAKTAAAKTAAAKTAAAKTTARSTTAKTAAAKTAAAKAAAEKAAADKAAAEKAAAAAAEAETVAATATPVVEPAPAGDQTAPVESASAIEPAPASEEPVRGEVEAPAVTAADDVAVPTEVEVEVESEREATSVEVVEAVVDSDDAASDAVGAADSTSDGEAISIRGLVKQFGDNRAVAGIDLTVPAGSFYGVVGPNGAGKTTTLSIVAGLLRADEGSVVICGIDQAVQPQAAKRMMGVLPDRLRTFDRLTGRQLLYYYGLLRGLTADVIEKRAADLARAFDLGDALSRVVSDYSAGMTKKIMLAGAMIHSPRVLVLDEPFESVDPVSSAVILDILRAYVSHGGTVVLSSHGMDLVERVCSRVAIIVNGEVLAEGTIDEVRAGQTLEARFVELAGSSGEVEGLEWLHTFSD
ncbi:MULTISPECIES: ABC transporter ATP-binding protein [unclassified Microbacterium]|uniref:ABC transporter ATP-binding protein n=2 Tax=Microbacterium TaxID=33882 RepID=UPI001E3AA353|nr:MULTISPECIES: ABC transporter ATP-binding protein [unclassified Microbacterium]